MLIVLTLLFAAVVRFLHLHWGNFYQLSVDPEYTLLYNGIVVSTGSFAINFIDHPATPSIFISGLSSLFVRLFSAEGSFVHDFISRPESYLQASQLFQLLLITFSCIYSGYKIRVYSQRKWMTYLPIVGLMSHYHLLEISIRFIPETTLLIPLFLMMALMIRFLYSGDQEKVQSKLLWQFPLLIGFGIACKLSFAPLFVLPLVILAGNKRKLWLLVRNTFLFTLLFAYPLFTNFTASSRWITKMLSHSGKHGSGESGFMAFDRIPMHAKSLFLDNPIFWILILLNLIVLVHLYLKPQTSILVKRVRRLMLGFLLSLLFLTLLILKHFALHYMMPFYVLSAMLLVFPLLHLQVELNFSYKKQSPILGGIALLLIVFTTLGTRQLWHEHEQWKNFQKQKQNEIQSLVKDEKAGLVIDAPHWGSPFPEYAHAFGFMHTYKRKTYFKEALRKKYPNFYLNVGWMPEFNHWDQFVDFDHIFSRSKVVYLYSGRGANGMPSILERLKAYRASSSPILQEVLWERQENAQLIRLEKIDP
ncbi:MAG: hypothetical protein RIC95_05805 [Vicingaceae bacterium]